MFCGHKWEGVQSYNLETHSYCGELIRTRYVAVFICSKCGKTKKRCYEDRETADSAIDVVGN